MELDVFIEKTLLNVISGIKKAQAKEGLHINWEEKIADAYATRMISFDVAVTVDEQKQSGVGAKISVLGNSLSGKLGDKVNQSSVSKIKFEIPLVYPAGKSFK